MYNLILYLGHKTAYMQILHCIYIYIKKNLFTIFIVPSLFKIMFISKSIDIKYSA